MYSSSLESLFHLLPTCIEIHLTAALQFAAHWAINVLAFKNSDFLPPHGIDAAAIFLL
jgi:hypothetical protein